MLHRARLALCLCLCPAAAWAKSPWARLAEDDLEAIHRTLKENHPGWVDEQNPAFRSWLEKGYGLALGRIRDVASLDGYSFLLKFYANGFKDSHLSLRVSARRDEAWWPGFVIARRGGRYVVHSIEADRPASELPSPGMELLSCDNREADRLMKEDVFPYEGNEAVPSGWIKQAPFLLIGRGNPWVKLYAYCDFKSGAERTRYLLLWDKRDLDFLRPRLSQAAFGPDPKFGVRPFGEGDNAWVSLPSFALSASAEIRKIVSAAQGLRDKSILVIDARGNKGGSSQWAGEFLKALYGTDYLAYRASTLRLAPGYKRPYVEWRVSRENQKYVAELAPALKTQFGDKSDVYLEWARVSVDMAAALKKGKSLYRQIDTPPLARMTPDKEAGSPVKGKVFFLTSGDCADACLALADGLLEIPGMVHVGLPTAADSLYAESRSVALPSGIAEISFAMKVYRDRPRGNNVFYAPLEFSGDMGNAQELERWIQDLAAKLE